LEEEAPARPLSTAAEAKPARPEALTVRWMEVRDVADTTEFTTRTSPSKERRMENLKTKTWT